MADSYNRIFRNMVSVDSLVLGQNDEGQICIEPANDTDLGFTMFGYMNEAGNTYKALAKNQDAYIKDLRLNGTSTTGSKGLLKHDTNGDITGGLMTIAQLEENLSESLPGGTVTGLNEDEILFGKADGTIDQSENLKFDGSKLVLGTGTPSQDLNLTPGADSKISCNGSLILEDDYIGSSLYSGDFKVAESITVWNSLVILDDSKSLAQYLIDAMQGVNRAEDRIMYGAPNGMFSSSANFQFSETMRLRCSDDATVDKDYTFSFGRYTTTNFEGAKFTGYTRFGSEDGTVQVATDLVLGVQTTGSNPEYLELEVGGTDEVLKIPDNRMMIVKFRMLSTSDTANEGYHIQEFEQVFWRSNTNWNAFELVEPTILKSYGGWDIEPLFYKGSTEGTYKIRIIVDDVPAGVVVNHVVHVTDMVITKSGYWIGC